MPEPTQDIQDIDQLVAQADTLVAELEAATTAMVQSTSDEGPTIEPKEWASPPESQASEAEPPDDSKPHGTKPAAEPAAQPADESVAESADEVPATSAQDAADASNQPSDAVDEQASQAVPADRPDPVTSEPSVPTETGADSKVDLPSDPAPESDSDPAPDSAAEAATKPTSQASAESTKAEPQESDESETASTHDNKPQSNVDQTARAETESHVETVDPTDPTDPTELQAGQAIRLDDPPRNERQDEPESTPDDAEEPICEIDSDESEHEPAGDILMDDVPSPAPAAKHELLADARAGSIQDTTEASERVRSLDDELARLADEMIEGDSDDNPNVLISAPHEDDDGSPASEETIASKQAPPSQREHAMAPSNASGSSGASGGSGAPDASDSQQADQPASSRPAAERPAAFKDRAWFYTKIASRRTVEIARERGPVIAAQLEPVARRACEQASRPLDKKKPIVRKMIGWVAASTAVYASVVLFYVAFIRKPPMIEPDQPGTTLIDNTGRPIASHPDGD